MTELAERLIHLLDGDLVELETNGGTIAAAVETNDHQAFGEDDGEQLWRHTIAFMPIGEDATISDADRFRVTVEPGPGEEWDVSELVAEVFVEDDFGYEERPEGELVDVRRLDRSM